MGRKLPASLSSILHDMQSPSIGFVGAGLSPLVIAWLGEAFGLGNAISLMALLYLIGVILLLLSRRVAIADMEDSERRIAATAAPPEAAQ